MLVNLTSHLQLKNTLHHSVVARCPRSRELGCLGNLIAFLMVFDGSKQILNLSFVSLIVMFLHQAIGSYCQQIFPSLSILFKCFLILECFATACRCMASWTGVTFGSKSKAAGFPNCPNPVCTSGNASRTHSRVISAGQDGNDMFGRGSSNIHGAGILSGSIGMSLVCEFSGVGSCTGGSGWGFWCVAAPGDVPNEWILSARIFTSPSFTQSEPDRKGDFPCICASLKT